MSLHGSGVEREFDEAAPRYDLMVALNPGYHAELRRAARLVVERPDARLRLLDLGCGSGASTRALLDVAGGRVTALLGVDASAGMLARARAKRWPDGVTFRRARIEEVGDAGESAEWDGAFAAYLFRNVAADDRDAALRTTYDLLEPGGTLVVQEYSVAGRPLPTAIWSAVCWFVVIPLSLLTSRRAVLYRYLWRSVLRFDSTQVFAERLTRAGFTGIRRVDAGGWQHGILHTFVATKP